MIKVLHPGLQSSFQDMGRFNMAKYAIPQSGVMDEYCAKQVNILLQNDKNCPVIEIALQGPKLYFEISTSIVCSGLGAEVFLNGTSILLNEVISIEKGDLLHIKRVVKGNYMYLGIRNGFDVKQILGSVSYFEDIAPSSLLKTNDILKVRSNTFKKKRLDTATNAHIKFNTNRYVSPLIDVYIGPEFHCLSLAQQRRLFNSEFRISKLFNRMAFQLEEYFRNSLIPIVTSTVIPGTVQLTPSGKLIVLMKDAQTTGGYPRVLQLSTTAISVLAQKRAADVIEFNRINYT